MTSVALHKLFFQMKGAILLQQIVTVRHILTHVHHVVNFWDSVHMITKLL